MLLAGGARGRDGKRWPRSEEKTSLNASIGAQQRGAPSEEPGRDIVILKVSIERTHGSVAFGDTGLLKQLASPLRVLRMYGIRRMGAELSRLPALSTNEQVLQSRVLVQAVAP